MEARNTKVGRLGKSCLPGNDNGGCPTPLRVCVMGVTAGELQGGPSQSGMEKQTVI